MNDENRELEVFDSAAVSADSPQNGLGIPSESLPEEANADLPDKRDVFWETPPEIDSWYNPPLPIGGMEPHSEKLLAEMRESIEKFGLPAHAIDLLWQYRVGAESAQRELQRVYEQTENYLHNLSDREHALAEELKTTREAYVKSFAKAGLAWPHEPPPHTKQQTQDLHAPLIVGHEFTPAQVEEALMHDVPTEEEMAGAHGIEPTSTKMSLLARVALWVLELFAPLASGLLLGLNAGVITGLLDLTDLKRGDRLWLLATAAIIGFCIEKLLGETHYNLFASLSRRLEPAPTASSQPAIARHRSVGVLIPLFLMLGVVDIAVIAVDALGLRMLHSQHIRDQQFIGVATDSLLPMYVYFLIGTIISMPYLLYKSMKGWKESEIRLRESTLFHLQRAHLEKRRAEAPVQEAFALAQRSVDLNQELHRLRQAIDAIRKLRDAARVAATGEANRFQRYWDSLVQTLEPPRESNSKNRKAKPADQEPRPSFLSRILGAFRR